MVEQATLDGVVVELQERLDQLLGILEALHRQADEQLQLKNGQLAPHRVVVELDADQRGDGGVIVHIAVVQALEQQLQRAVVQAVQVEDVGAERQGPVGVVPDQVLDRVDLRVTRHQDAARGGTEVVVHRHVHFFAQVFEDAKELVEAFLQFNDNTVERGLFYQALNVVLEVVLDDELEMEDYETNFRRMFGNPRMDAVLGSVDGSVRFHGLTPTSMKLEGLDRHLRLIESYKKLHAARAKFA